MRAHLLVICAAACAPVEPPPDDTDDTEVDETDDTEVDETDDTEVDETDDTEVDETDETDDTDALPDGPPRYTLRVVASPEGRPYTQVLGGSADGAFVGYAGAEEWSPTARALLVATGESEGTELDAPKDGQVFAYDVRGTQVVGKALREPAVWTGGVHAKLKVPEGYFSGVARGIGAAGLLVGSYADEDDVWLELGPRPCTWSSTSAVPVRLATLDPAVEVGAAIVVADSGTIAGFVSTAGGFRAVTWAGPGAAAVDLGTPSNALLSESAGIDEHGHVVGRVTFTDPVLDFISLGFTTVGGFTELDGLGEGWTEVSDIDDRHVMVGTSRAPGPVMRAVLWWDGEVYDLEDRVDALPEGVVRLARAVAIDDAGRIAVDAVTDSGGQVVLVAEPVVPEAP